MVAALLTEGFDRLFVRAALRSRRPPARLATRATLERLDEAARFFTRAVADGRLFPEASAIAPAEIPVRSLGDGAVVDLSWPSGYHPLSPAYAALVDRVPQTRMCRVRWFRHARVRAPAVLCLHGWGAGMFALEERDFAASALYRRGLDVLLVTLPFHARRGARLSLPPFPSPNPYITNEGCAQAVFELRALAGWLRGRGAPSVGVFGMSLGGFTAALLATVEARIDFVVPIIPVASAADMMWHVGRGTKARARAEALGLTRERFTAAFAATCPLEREPRVARQRVLVIAGARDRVIPADHAARLQAHLSSRPLVAFPGAHLLQLGRGHAFRAALAFLRSCAVLPERASEASG